jgi:hypothetical protein
VQTSPWGLEAFSHGSTKDLSAGAVQWLGLIFVVFLNSAGDQTQGFRHPRQVLLSPSHIPSPWFLLKHGSNS